MAMNITSDECPPLSQLQKRHWNAAHILHANNIPACLVGSPASAFYGSNDLWIQIPIIVHDPAFEDACKLLSANGDREIEVLTYGHPHNEYSMPEKDASGKKYVEWRRFSSGVLLAPASHWHFEITKDTTIVVDGLPLPKYVPYLQGKLRRTLLANYLLNVNPPFSIYHSIRITSHPSI